jgi:RNA-binding protein
MNSKERAKLRSLAQNIKVIGQIGKGGFSDTQIQSFDDAIEKNELIKLKVLENCEYVAFEAGNILAEKLNATFVCAVGRTIVLYRRSKRDGINHIEF